MSKIELSLTTSEQVDLILRLVKEWGIGASIVCKEGDIYDSYKSSTARPVTCDYSVLPPTRDEMLLRDEWTVPSGHLKGYITKEYLNRYGEIRRKNVYKFLNDQIAFRSLTVIGEMVYLNTYLQDLLQTCCGSMTFVEIYKKVDENLIAV